MTRLDPFPGMTGTAIAGEGMTLARWRFEAGAEFPEHSHAAAQLTWVISGRLELTVDGVPLTLGPGDHAAVAAWVPHSGRALEATEVVDSFTPGREW